MTYSEALQNGYRNGDLVYTPKYISRKIVPGDQEVHTAGSYRYGQLYVELPNWRSTRFSFRQYLVKEDKS